MSEAQEQRFLAAVAASGGSAGNQRLQAELGWADSTYQRVKQALIETGRIAPGRGRGGSVRLAGTDTNKAKHAGKPPSTAPKVVRNKARADLGRGTGSGYAQAFNAIDKTMRNDEGLASELDYAEQPRAAKGPGASPRVTSKTSP